MKNIIIIFRTASTSDSWASDFGGEIIRGRFTWCTGQGTPYYRLKTMGSARCYDGQRIDIVIVTT